MNITPELLIALAGLIAGLTAAMRGHHDGKMAARKDVVTSLQEQVARADERAMLDHERIVKLEQERNSCSDRILELETERAMRAAEVLQLQRRVTDAENRMAREEKRTADAENAANDLRQALGQLQMELERERANNQNQINKLVVIIENLYKRLIEAGIDPGLKLDDLKRMMVITKTGPL